MTRSLWWMRAVRATSTLLLCCTKSVQTFSAKTPVENCLFTSRFHSPAATVSSSTLVGDQRLVALARRSGSRSRSRLWLSPETTTAAAEILLVGAAGGGLWWWTSGSEKREEEARIAALVAADEEGRRRRAGLAHVDYREEPWTETELAAYDGTDPDGPLLVAVDGDVFNVWRSRHFYGPGCEYEIMGGRDATRFLARNSLDEETNEEKMRPLNVVERASLEGWYWTFKNKYEIVGRLEGY